MKKLTLTSSAMFHPGAAAPVRRRGKRETRVPEVIDVSIDVLIATGYAGYSINRVANDAGIRLSTLQHYFPTREALLRATLEEIARRHLERFRAVAKNRNRSAQARLIQGVKPASVAVSAASRISCARRRPCCAERDSM